MTRRPTIADVAAAAGVSMATVSKAVNGRYGVRDSTAERVRKVAQELGYESSLVASSMRSRRTGVVGVLVAAFEPFSTEVLKGVALSLRSTSYELLAYSGAGRFVEGWERRSVSRLSGTLIDGAILVTPTVIDLRTDIPIVAIDPHTGPAGLPTVESDNFAGARTATAHLVELGHRRIGFVAGRPGLRSSLLREAGYRRALDDAGIAFDPALVRVGRYEPEAAREPAAALLAEPDPPTAVFAANDLSAISVIEVAQEHGLDVPGDLSVIGFDDVPEASQSTPALTTIRQSMQRLGSTGADLLVDLLEQREPEAVRVTLPTRLIPRATTAPPRA